MDINEVHDSSQAQATPENYCANCGFAPCQTIYFEHLRATEPCTTYYDPRPITQNTAALDMIATVHNAFPGVDRETAIRWMMAAYHIDEQPSTATTFTDKHSDTYTTNSRY